MIGWVPGPRNPWEPSCVKKLWRNAGRLYTFQYQVGRGIDNLEPKWLTFLDLRLDFSTFTCSPFKEQVAYHASELASLEKAASIGGLSERE